MEKDNIHIGFGIMGGYNQAQAHAQFVSNLVDYNMNIQAALEAPRFTKLTFGGCDVMIENRVPAACARGAGGARAQSGSAGGFLGLDGRRAGGAARFGCGSELRRVVAAQGWRGRAGGAAVFRRAGALIDVAKIMLWAIHICLGSA
jgi:hypothetical protein